jgi:hypothetical protein
LAAFFFATGLAAKVALLGLFLANSIYFAPSEKPFMVNFRIENLVELLRVLPVRRRDGGGRTGGVQKTN